MGEGVGDPVGPVLGQAVLLGHGPQSAAHNRHLDDHNNSVAHVLGKGKERLQESQDEDTSKFQRWLGTNFNQFDQLSISL